MTAPNTVPTTSSIFQYPPNFPNGQVADIWNAYFASLNTAFSTAPSVLGAVAYTVLANPVSASEGAGLVGWNGALSYPGSTIGNGLVTEIATRIIGDTNAIATAKSQTLASLSADNGSTLVTYLAPYTGAVATTQDKVNQFILSAKKDFGVRSEEHTSELQSP
jgi:hypothetical protein